MRYNLNLLFKKKKKNHRISKSIRKRVYIKKNGTRGISGKKKKREILLKLFFCDKSKESRQIDDTVASIDNFLASKCVCTKCRVRIE